MLFGIFDCIFIIIHDSLLVGDSFTLYTTKVNFLSILDVQFELLALLGGNCLGFILATSGSDSISVGEVTDNWRKIEATSALRDANSTTVFH